MNDRGLNISSLDVCGNPRTDHKASGPARVGAAVVEKHLFARRAMKDFAQLMANY
jgi:hypothetical protein